MLTVSKILSCISFEVSFFVRILSNFCLQIVFDLSSICPNSDRRTGKGGVFNINTLTDIYLNGYIIGNIILDVRCRLMVSWEVGDHVGDCVEESGGFCVVTLTGKVDYSWTNLGHNHSISFPKLHV